MQNTAQGSLCDLLCVLAFSDCISGERHKEQAVVMSACDAGCDLPYRTPSVCGEACCRAECTLM